MGIDGAPVLGGVNSCLGDLTRIMESLSGGWCRGTGGTLIDPAPAANHLRSRHPVHGDLIVICAISRYILFAAMPCSIHAFERSRDESDRGSMTTLK